MNRLQVEQELENKYLNKTVEYIDLTTSFIGKVDRIAVEGGPNDYNVIVMVNYRRYEVPYEDFIICTDLLD